MYGSSEYLEEKISRVLGDLIQEGFVCKIADDLYIGGDTIEELFNNYSKVLQRIQLNNLSLVPQKTVICPKKTGVLGWIWNSGTLTPSAHKISPLTASNPPKTCTALRSYIGDFKALSRCIPQYSSIMSPLEDSIKGMQGNQQIQWSSELIGYFHQSQEALRKHKTITIPKPSDQLVITTDGSPLNKGLSATLFIQNNNDH